MLNRTEIKELIEFTNNEYQKKISGEPNRFSDCIEVVEGNIDDKMLSEAFARFCADKIEDMTVLDDDRAYFALFACEFGGLDGYGFSWSDAVDVINGSDIFIGEELLRQILIGSLTVKGVSKSQLTQLAKKIAGLGYYNVLIEFAPRSLYSLDDIIDEYFGGINAKTKISDEDDNSIKKIIEEVCESQDEDALTRLKKKIFATGNSYVIKDLIGFPGINNVEVINHITSIDVLETVASTNYHMAPEERRELHNAILDQMLDMRDPQNKNYEDCLVYCVYADPEKFAGLITSAKNAEKVVKIIGECDREDDEKLALLLPYGEIIAEKGDESQNITYILAYLAVAKEIDIKIVLDNIKKISDPANAIKMMKMMVEEYNINPQSQNKKDMEMFKYLSGAVIENGTEIQNFNMAMIDGRFIDHAKAISNPELLMKMAKVAQGKCDMFAAEFLLELANGVKENMMNRVTGIDRGKI